MLSSSPSISFPLMVVSNISIFLLPLLITLTIATCVVFIILFVRKNKSKTLLLLSPSLLSSMPFLLSCKCHSLLSSLPSRLSPSFYCQKYSPTTLSSTIIISAIVVTYSTTISSAHIIKNITLTLAIVVTSTNACTIDIMWDWKIFYLGYQVLAVFLVGCENIFISFIKIILMRSLASEM